MGIKIGDKLTPVTPLQFIQGLAQGWVNLFVTPPSKQELLILMAQSAIETGRWRYIHRYNFGNVKSVDGDGRDFCYFACWEIFSKPVAAAYVANSKPGAEARITDEHSNGTSTVWFYPEHPACRFRAYLVLKDDLSEEDSWSSLVLGMTDYLGLLYKRFNKSWEALATGDPAAFVRALKAQGYFTANVDDYVKSVVSLVNEFDHINVDMNALPIIPSNKLELITDFSDAVKQEYLSDLKELEQT